MPEDRYRLSFDSVADTYERTRPLYAPDALAFIAQRFPLTRVLDLAAGTGKLTRQLVALGADVVAVEPGDAMRGLLEQVVPEAQALGGSAEDIPLPDGSVDVVTVGQAFHWFRPDEALAEMHRVLRPGGGYALLWNKWDDDDPVLHELNEIIERMRPEGTHGGAAAWEHALASTSLFTPPEEHRFRHVERLDVDTIVGRVSSVSAIAAASPEEQARAEAEVRAIVREPEIDFPMTTGVFVADRVS